MICTICTKKISYHESYEIVDDKKVHGKCVIKKVIELADEDLPMKPEGSA